MERKEIERLHREYFEAFGELPPVSADDDFYSERLIGMIKAALQTGEPIHG